MQMTGAEILIASLIEQEVKIVFGYPGGTVIDVYDAMDKRSGEITHILSSHEQGAAHAADGYSRSTGKTGVAIATSGPGATNLVTGIATAYLDSIPMVAITGNVARPLLGRDTFQEVDIVGVTVPVTKHNFFVNDIEKLAETVREAFVIANSGRPGPVLIDIPKDIFAGSTEYVPAGKFEKRPLSPLRMEYVDEAVKMINEAKNPVIYFGGGIISAGAGDELLEFARKIDSPMTSTAMGISVLRYDEPLNLGLVGMHGTPVSNYAIDRCDLLLCIGARFSDRVTGDKSRFASHAKIIHVDTDLSEVGKNIPTHLNVVGDAKLVLQAFLDRVETNSHGEWLNELEQYDQKYPLPTKMSNSDSVSPQDVLEAVRVIFGDDTIIVTDVGQHQMTTVQHYKFTKPRSFLSSCGLGTMGYGMGAAVGAQMGNPDSPVVLITGDGCFHMNMAEFAVAVTNDLPMVVIIMNNGVLGMVRQWQSLFYAQRYSNTTLNRKTDYVKIAEAFGGVGLRISSTQDIFPVLREAQSCGKPVIVDCVISKNEGVFPIIPPGKAIGDAIYE